MKNFTTKQEIRDLLNKVIMDEISFTRMVEIMNERVNERVSERVRVRVSERMEEMNKPQYIPIRKFKKGDKVRIKHGVSSKTHRDISPGFIVQMDDLIGKELTVDRYANGMVYVEESYYFHEDWLEPYVEELKEGDIAIFWDLDKGRALIGKYNRFHEDSSYPHRDNRNNIWVNAIKFESVEQYKKLLKGEI
jgi:uncharacterized protein YodC (DUF2158 family)